MWLELRRNLKGKSKRKKKLCKNMLDYNPGHKHTLEEQSTLARAVTFTIWLSCDGEPDICQHRAWTNFKDVLGGFCCCTPQGKLRLKSLSSRCSQYHHCPHGTRRAAGFPFSYCLLTQRSTMFFNTLKAQTRTNLLSFHSKNIQYSIQLQSAAESNLECDG